MANPYLTVVPSDEKLTLAKYEEINDAIRREDLNYLQGLVKTRGRTPAVNLSGDPLLNVLLAYRKTELVLKLVASTPEENLEAVNDVGDTALHVAVAQGDIEAAKAIIYRNKKLVGSRNNQLETPLHKAALYGEKRIFWELVNHDSETSARRKDGATVLHCAVMGNAPKLALKIAKKYPHLVTSRNENAVTPLQLMVTIPQAFRSRVHLDILESIIYECIPLEESDSDSEEHGEQDVGMKTHRAVADADGDDILRLTKINREKFPPNCATLLDLVSLVCIPVRWARLLVSNILKQCLPCEERNSTSEECEGDDEELNEPSRKPFQDQGDAKKDDILSFLSRSHKKFPPNYATFFDLIVLLCIPVGWIRALTFNILKQLSSRVEFLEEIKKNHKEAMKLIAHLAKDPEYWDSIDKGRTPEQGMNLMRRDLNPQEMGSKEEDAKEAQKTRWDESPLILGAKMGLHEFVKQILTVHPESAKYVDSKERNVLQLAIQHGHVKIVEIVEEMATGSNPVLPSWLLSFIDKDTKNTILHFAAETTVKDEADPLQMQHELHWFERVKKLVPKDLEHSRNENEKTAQELFTEKHKEMVRSGKTQLTDLGKTGASLVAAVVFASSFSIPGEKDSNQNPVFLHKTAFKVFSHAYVVGLSCASTSLVLFLSLVTASYREQEFRWALPTKYFLATTSFFLALVGLLVAFSCNIYLNIYGGRRAETSDIVPLVCELAAFPFACWMVMVFRHRGGAPGLGGLRYSLRRLSV